jgi:hypothetical protein
MTNFPIRAAPAPKLGCTSKQGLTWPIDLRLDIRKVILVYDDPNALRRLCVQRFDLPGQLPQHLGGQVLVSSLQRSVGDPTQNEAVAKYGIPSWKKETT